MLDRLVLVAALGAVLGSAPAGAHHSFPVHFVAGKLVTVSGVVTGFNFRNPHGLLKFTVAGDGGAARLKSRAARS
jgi:hypothetical protein